jgi:hypothetical protein
MITIAQIDTLTSCCKHFLQKLKYARSAAMCVEAKEKAPALDYSLDLARRMAERQEQDVIRLADELSDELTKLLKPAAAEQRGIS